MKNQINTLTAAIAMCLLSAVSFAQENITLAPVGGDSITTGHQKKLGMEFESDAGETPLCRLDGIVRQADAASNYNEQDMVKFEGKKTQKGIRFEIDLSNIPTGSRLFLIASCLTNSEYMSVNYYGDSGNLETRGSFKIDSFVTQRLFIFRMTEKGLSIPHGS